MEWCNTNKHAHRLATREQRRLMGIASARVRELKRLNAEPPIYHPIGQPFCGLIYSLNCQYEQPVEQTILLFDTGRRDSYRAIVNNIEQSGRAGWHEWHALNAKNMQRRFLSE